MSFNIDQEFLNALVKFDVKIVGDRLKQVRLHYSAHRAQKITQTNISEILGLNDSNATLSNLEGGKGAIGNFIKLLALYHSLGYNLNWIILPDNTYEDIVNQSRLRESFQAFEEVDINEIMYEKNLRVKNALRSLAKVEEELKESLK